MYAFLVLRGEIPELQGVHIRFSGYCQLAFQITLLLSWNRIYATDLSGTIYIPFLSPGVIVSPELSPKSLQFLPLSAIYVALVDLIYSLQFDNLFIFSHSGGSVMLLHCRFNLYILYR